MGCSHDQNSTLNSNRKESEKNKALKLDEYSISANFKLKYEFVSTLGSGSFGKVKLYQDKKCNDIKFAIKTVSKEDSFILDEIKILRTIDHPNIVKYFETYEDGKNIHIVMEYIPGSTLDKVITKLGKKKITENDCYKVLCCLLRAILFLHNMNIMHKDLKLENILFSVIGKYDSLKIIDFGLSSRQNVNKKGKSHSEDYRVGTTHYMAPEVVKFEKLSPKVDIWAIGVIIYRIFTGNFPFDGSSEKEIFAKIVKGEYDESKLDRQKISKELKDLIKRFLTLKVKDRISVNEALEHEWFLQHKIDNEIVIDREMIVNLSKFEKANCLQKEILFYLAKIANDYEIDNYKHYFSSIDTNNNGVIEMEEIFNTLKQHENLSDVILLIKL